MAVIGSDNLTLLDWAKLRDPDGLMAEVALMLSQRNEILIDQVYKEGNQATGHRYTVETSLPEVYYKMMGAGVRSSKGETAQVTEECSILEGWSEVDEDTADLNGDGAKMRVYQAGRFMEAMNQKQALGMFYGSKANKEEYVGFANRYSALTADVNSQNVLDAEGTAARTSVYLIGWGDDTIYSIFPKGSQAGISHKYHGERVIDGVDGDGNETKRVALSDQWKWKHGLVVNDWQFGVRIANINTAELKTLSGTQAVTASTSVIYKMLEAIDRLPRQSGIKPCFYVNRTVASALRLAAWKSTTSVLTIEKGMNQFGPDLFTVMLQGIPVRICDQLTNLEDAVA